MLGAWRLLVLDLAPNEVEDFLGDLPGQQRQDDPDRQVDELHAVATSRACRAARITSAWACGGRAAPGTARPPRAGRPRSAGRGSSSALSLAPSRITTFDSHSQTRKMMTPP